MAGSTIFFLVLVGAVGACRLVELRLSRRHQRALAAGGAAVLPEPVFPAMVALHTGILVAAVLETLLARAPVRRRAGDPGGRAGGAGERAALLGDRDAGRALERARRAVDGRWAS